MATEIINTNFKMEYLTLESEEGAKFMMFATPRNRGGFHGA
jgi:hypothetical protein